MHRISEAVSVLQVRHLLDSNQHQQTSNSLASAASSALSIASNLQSTSLIGRLLAGTAPAHPSVIDHCSSSTTALFLTDMDMDTRKRTRQSSTTSSQQSGSSSSTGKRRQSSPVSSKSMSIPSSQRENNVLASTIPHPSTFPTASYTTSTESPLPHEVASSFQPFASSSSLSHSNGIRKALPHEMMNMNDRDWRDHTVANDKLVSFQDQGLPPASASLAVTSEDDHSAALSISKPAGTIAPAKVVKVEEIAYSTFDTGMDTLATDRNGNVARMEEDLVNHPTADRGDGETLELQAISAMPVNGTSGSQTPLPSDHPSTCSTPSGPPIVLTIPPRKGPGRPPGRPPGKRPLVIDAPAEAVIVASDAEGPRGRRRAAEAALITIRKVAAKKKTYAKKQSRTRSIYTADIPEANFELILHGDPHAGVSVYHLAAASIIDQPFVLDPISVRHCTTALTSAPLTSYLFEIPTETQRPIDGLLIVNIDTSSDGYIEEKVLLGLGNGELRVEYRDYTSSSRWSIRGGSMRVLEQGEC